MTNPRIYRTYNWGNRRTHQTMLRLVHNSKRPFGCCRKSGSSSHVLQSRFNYIDQTNILSANRKNSENNSYYICDLRYNQGPDLRNTFSYICDFFQLAYRRTRIYLVRLVGRVEHGMAHIPGIRMRVKQQ